MLRPIGSGDSWKTGPEALGIATKLNLFGNDRVNGCIGFADGHVTIFTDKNRDGQFGHTQGIIDGINAPRYDELEPKVFGGWLNKPGLPF